MSAKFKDSRERDCEREYRLYGKPSTLTSTQGSQKLSIH